MPTKISDIIVQVRSQLIEDTARFWSDNELIRIIRLGALDLWGAILDLHQDHYFKVVKSVVLKANEEELSGVPIDCFRVQLIEPADTTDSATGRQFLFVPRKYKDADFAVARTLAAQDPSMTSNRTIYYQLVGVGSPIEAPKILTAPKLSSDLPIRLAYNPTIWPYSDEMQFNPVPGETDNALKAWALAYARAKETEDRQPDAGWLSIYGTEKKNVLVRLTPREEQEPEVVEDFMQGFGSFW